jgi:hypothetical protein
VASPHSTFTELVTTTFRKHRKQVIDNMSNNNALLNRIMKKGQYKLEDGGLTIVQPLEYANNSTYQRYSGYDTLNISASDVISAAEFAWKQIAISIVANGRELRINSGDSAIVKLASSRLKNAIRTFKNNFSADLYSDGTLSNQINGLQALVADAGTGTVGGINSSTWSFWQNTVQSAAAPLQGGSAITPSSSTMESLMLPLWLQLTRGDDKPDLIVADNNYFSFFELSQTPLRRYAPSDEGKTGFTSMKYKTADVIFDGGSGIPADHMYFLNTDYINLCVHRDADLEILEEMRPINQDAAVRTVLWMGNLTVGNRRLQGVQKA